MERKGQKQVIVGMTGGVDSTVAAYLMKKQGFNCIGVSVVFAGGSASTLSKCQAQELDRAKMVCQELDIPFYAIMASDRFKGEVVDRVIAARLSGKDFSTCYRCHNIVIDLLVSRMKTLQASHVVTGHYARLLKSSKTDSLNIHSSVDLKADQSHYLSLCSGDSLKKLILPLADLKKEEVKRIYSTLSLTLEMKEDTKKERCFAMPGPFSDYFLENVAQPLRPAGVMFSALDESFVGEHEGIHSYSVGQNRLEGSGDHVIDQSLRIVRIDPNKKQILVGPETLLQAQYLEFSDFKKVNLDDFTRPRTVYIYSDYLFLNGEECKLATKEKPISGILFIKPNGVALVELNSMFQINWPPGISLAFYDRPEHGASLLGVATLVHASPFIELNRIPKEDEEFESEGEEAEQERAKKKQKEYSLF